MAMAASLLDGADAYAANRQLLEVTGELELSRCGRDVLQE
jgi:hypothetical protein